MNTVESTFTGTSSLYVSGLQIDDILAIQSIYGANYSTRADNTVYGIGNGFGVMNTSGTPSEFVYTIWDGGGINVIDATDYQYASGNGAHIDLRQGRSPPSV